MDIFLFFFFQAEDGIRDVAVTGVQTCALPIFDGSEWRSPFTRMEACDDKQRRLGEDGRIRSDAEQLDRRRPGKAQLRSVIPGRKLREIGQLGESRKRRVQRRESHVDARCIEICGTGGWAVEE